MASSISLEEEVKVVDDLIRCTFGITQLTTVRCAIELGIPDMVENHPNGITLAELSSVVGCPVSSLHRLMRFLIYHGFFKQVKTNDPDSPIVYTQTALSHLITKNKMAPLLLLSSNPEAIACKLSLSNFLVSKNREKSAFELANGVDLWQYVTANPSFNELFNKGLGFIAKRTIDVLIEHSKAVFHGIGCLVDVGGGDGTALRAIVKACPGITRAINFDLPQVVSSSSKDDLGCLEHVGGDMFESVPKADAALIKSVLHDWDDEECVKILKNIKEAIPRESGKVIIVEIVMDDGDDVLNEGDNKYRELHLGSDMEMLVQTLKGKERTWKEWGDILKAAGFTNHTITPIPAPQSIIQAYP